MAIDDLLGELVKKSYVVYTKPMELASDGAKFGLPNSTNGFFITHANVTEIILGDKCLNIFVLQLWMMFMNDWSTSIGFAPVYDFLEPQSIRCTKDTREECQQYIETWVKDDGSRSLLRTLLQSGTLATSCVVSTREHCSMVLFCTEKA